MTRSFDSQPKTSTNQSRLSSQLDPRIGKGQPHTAHSTEKPNWAPSSRLPDYTFEDSENDGENPAIETNPTAELVPDPNTQPPLGNGQGHSAQTALEAHPEQAGLTSPDQQPVSQPVSTDGSGSSGNGSIGSEDSDASDLEPERGLLPVLKNRDFLTLWSGQVFSQLADKVYLVLMIALISTRFQAENQSISGWVSSLMVAFTIPAVLFGSIAGVYVDHWRKRAVLVSTNLLRGGLVLSLPILLWATQGWTGGSLPVGFLIVLGVTFLVSTLTQFFAPAEQAVIPLIVDRRHLLSANSLYTMTMMASVIVGFALGEPLLALADTIATPIAQQFHFPAEIGREVLVGGSYAAAGLLLMLLRTNEKTIDSDETLPDVWVNIRDGLRYLKEKSHVRAAMIHLVILFSIFAALAVLAVRLAEVMPEIKASQFGFLLAAGGVGMAIGAVLVGQFGQRFTHAQLSLFGSIGMALALAMISFVSHHLLPTLPLLVVLGACAATAGVPMQTAIQEETPEDMRGKVFGLQNNAINIALSLPLALAGVAETLFGLQAVFLALAALALLGGTLTWSLSRQSFHQS
jgi:predicted MFS family arabinose efflux permease